jgi:hypothetical protein
MPSSQENPRREDGHDTEGQEAPGHESPHQDAPPLSHRERDGVRVPGNKG